VIEFGLLCMGIGCLVGAAAAGMVALWLRGREDRRRDSLIVARLIAAKPLPLLEAAANPVAETATRQRRGLRGLLDRPWGETAAARNQRLGRKPADTTDATAALLAAQAVTGEQVLVAGKDVDLVPSDVKTLPIVSLKPERAPDVHPATGRPVPAWAKFDTSTWRSLDVSGRPDPGPEYVAQQLGRHASFEDVPA
jgi:hypothetical protein